MINIYDNMYTHIELYFRMYKYKTFTTNTPVTCVASQRDFLGTNHFLSGEWSGVVIMYDITSGLSTQ